MDVASRKFWFKLKKNLVAIGLKVMPGDDRAGQFRTEVLHLVLSELVLERYQSSQWTGFHSILEVCIFYE